MDSRKGAARSNKRKGQDSLVPLAHGRSSSSASGPLLLAFELARALRHRGVRLGYGSTRIHIPTVCTVPPRLNWANSL